MNYDPGMEVVGFEAKGYDSQGAHLVAKDPIRFAGGQANLYGYVDGDPVNEQDPFGLQSFAAEAVWDAIGAGWGAAAAEPSFVGEVAMAAVTAAVFIAVTIPVEPPPALFPGFSPGARDGAWCNPGDALVPPIPIPIAASPGSDFPITSNDRHQHCLRLYVQCTSSVPQPWTFWQGKSCQNCFDMCRAEGTWPWELCSNTMWH